ncbi:ribosomal protein L29 [Thermocrinis albus DSM 14484]|uniref:Large ribosomal subunit protein uL29 n=1 Tax=Thermocrinis albus (strain DSM 14484 / JCM 11386 / HI 11/12) TaxID=638303 RepID=D3SQ07_THEAH|nr:50S ribosomal protein L29 [Thermocrinis albus]ADC89244.1 ribosomal protein L29 [Thermocrinis albus DSM 14484]
MKASELRSLSLADLLKKEEELRRQILRLRIKKKVEGLKDINEIRKVRKDLARVLTVIREKQLRGET